MARTRNIKPGFFMNEELARIAPLGRLLFAGLPTIADRAGRLEDRPNRIKASLLPYDVCDIEALLESLHSSGFIQRYSFDAIKVIQIVTFKKHQRPYKDEPLSNLPPPDGPLSSIEDQGSRGEDRGSNFPDYRLPDRGGNVREQHPRFPSLWLSSAEDDRLHKKFAKRGLRPEFFPEAYAAVHNWFTESVNGRKAYPTSSEHSRRIADFGLDKAIKKQTDADNAAAAANRAAGRFPAPQTTDMSNHPSRKVFKAGEQK